MDDKIYSICIYGAGEEYNRIISTIKSMCSRIRVVSIVTSSKMMFSSIDGYKCNTPDEVNWDDVDYVVIASADWKNILETLNEYQVGREKILASAIFRIPFLDFEKYLKIKNSCPTIFANTCLAGMIYNELDLPFYTPTIASVCMGNEYIKFLKDYSSYLNKEMKIYDSKGYTFQTSILNPSGYPAGIIDDVCWYFVHSSDNKQSVDEWNRRRAKININNVTALMLIENDEQAYEFNNLNIKHKLGFYWRDLKLKDVMYIPGWEDFGIREKYNWYFRNLVQDFVTNTFESKRPAAVDWIKFLNGEEDYRRC